MHYLVLWNELTWLEIEIVSAQFQVPFYAQLREFDLILRIVKVVHCKLQLLNLKCLINMKMTHDTLAN